MILTASKQLGTAIMGDAVLNIINLFTCALFHFNSARPVLHLYSTFLSPDSPFSYSSPKSRNDFNFNILEET
jgi:hypothetical protein